MPCTDGRDNSAYAYEQLKERTDQLCAALKKLDQHGIAIPNNSKWWWDAHKEEDRRREEAERQHKADELQRKRLIERMSPEEKRILGIR